jgi:hypothetical protein
MKKFKLFSLAMACLLAFSFTSCGGDDEVENAKTFNLSSSAPFVVTNYYPTSAKIDSTYALSFTAALSNGYITVTGQKPTEGYFAVLSHDFVTGVKIADYGKAKSLSKVTSIPAAGKFSNKVAVEKGHGYVIKAYGTLDLAALGAAAHHPGLYNPDTLYIRVCLEDELDNGGFKMTYEYPFVPTE